MFRKCSPRRKQLAKRDCIQFLMCGALKLQGRNSHLLQEWGRQPCRWCSAAICKEARHPSWMCRNDATVQACSPPSRWYPCDTALKEGAALVDTQCECGELLLLILSLITPKLAIYTTHLKGADRNAHPASYQYSKYSMCFHQIAS